MSQQSLFLPMFLLFLDIGYWLRELCSLLACSMTYPIVDIVLIVSVSSTFIKASIEARGRSIIDALVVRSNLCSREFHCCLGDPLQCHCRTHHPRLRLKSRVLNAVTDPSGSKFVVSRCESRVVLGRLARYWLVVCVCNLVQIQPGLINILLCFRSSSMLHSMTLAAPPKWLIFYWTTPMCLLLLARSFSIRGLRVEIAKMFICITSEVLPSEACRAFSFKIVSAVITSDLVDCTPDLPF